RRGDGRRRLGLRRGGGRLGDGPCVGHVVVGARRARAALLPALGGAALRAGLVAAVLARGGRGRVVDGDDAGGCRLGLRRGLGCRGGKRQDGRVAALGRRQRD